MPNPSKEDVIAFWAKVDDTQMHFNEMSVKSRQLGLTFVTAALALAVVLITQEKEFALEFVTRWGVFRLHLAVLLIGAAAVGLLAVKRLDLSVYHRMLRGAVEFGNDFEEHYMKTKVFDLDKGMTQTISLYSRFKDASFTEQNGRRTYVGGQKYTAGQKLEGFYKGALWSLVIAAGLILLITNLGVSSKNSAKSVGTTVQVQEGKRVTVQVQNAS
jgi:hypothetical protein